MEGAFIDLLSKNIFALKDDFCGSMLSWFSSCNIRDFAWITFDHDQRAILPCLKKLIQTDLRMVLWSWSKVIHAKSLMLQLLNQESMDPQKSSLRAKIFLLKRSMNAPSMLEIWLMPQWLKELNTLS
jgi:hypothetical protein